MTDPITGIEVPVLAVTLHPQTKQWLTLGGTYYNPLTKTLAPLELGGPMEDPVTGGISPILGVGLDENTGLLAALSALLPLLLHTWPGFPIPRSQPPRPSMFWSRLQTPPQPIFPPIIFTLPLTPTFPLLPAPLTPPPSPAHCPREEKENRALSAVKVNGCFPPKRASFSLLSPPCYPSGFSLATYSPPTHSFQSRIPIVHSALRPWFSLIPHLPASSRFLFAPHPLGFPLSGQVLALGGLRDASGNLMLPGDSFVEPLSKKTVRIQGASQQEGQTLPQVGGSQALLDANVLVAQRQVIAVIRQCQQRPALRVQGLLEAAIKDMRHALALSLHHVLQQARRLERQLEAAHGIKASGGRIGTCRPKPIALRP